MVDVALMFEAAEVLMRWCKQTNLWEASHGTENSSQTLRSFEIPLTHGAKQKCCRMKSQLLDEKQRLRLQSFHPKKMCTARMHVLRCGPAQLSMLYTALNVA